MARIPFKTLASEWRKDPSYVATYDALEEEFAIVSATIGARQRARLTQSQLAKRMGTSQSAIARLEGGKTPSMKTLRSLAAATGSMLRIEFVPLPKPAARSKKPAQLKPPQVSPRRK